MKHEIRVFFTALMFYTRIPCPKWVDHSPEFISKSIRYFPLIGWLVGSMAAGAYLLGNWAVSPLFGILFSFVASVLATGAFHEDGFADACDGFGGGWTKDRILLIMKDSRVGAYGVIGLILIYFLKASVLMEISTSVDSLLVAAVLVSGHAISRFMAATFVFTHQYVRETGDSKAKPVAKQKGKTNLIVAAIFGLLPFIAMSVLMENYFLIVITPLLYIVKMWLGRYFTKWIGGYTGDCLGATQQIIEVVFYVFMVVTWKFTL
jgi:adenosylcobinamide-GDP ribazoletransferase